MLMINQKKGDGNSRLIIIAFKHIVALIDYGSETGVLTSAQVEYRAAEGIESVSARLPDNL